MPRGQPINIRCPKCKVATTVDPTGRERKRRYAHGNNTGLPDSDRVVEVVSHCCQHRWFSRHPDAEVAHSKIHERFYDEFGNLRGELVKVKISAFGFPKNVICLATSTNAYNRSLRNIDWPMRYRSLELKEHEYVKI